MPFTPENIPRNYVSSPAPVLDRSKAIYLEKELDKIEAAIASLSRSVREIQEHLDTLP